jgi:hypothetical protein
MMFNTCRLNATWINSNFVVSEQFIFQGRSFWPPGAIAEAHSWPFEKVIDSLEMPEILTI